MAPVTVVESVTGVLATVVVASVNPSADTTFVRFPELGIVLAELFDHEYVTVGLDEPDFHMVAWYTTLKEVIVVLVPLASRNVALPLLAVPEPRNDMLLLPYQPPLVPPV